MKKNTPNVREMCLTALFAALTAVLAQIAIPIPISPVPISFGMVAVYASGMLLAPRAALLSQLVYLLLGACGAPVFHNFTGGLGILFGPTGGYLFAYPLMALLISGYFWLSGQHNKKEMLPLLEKRQQDSNKSGGFFSGLFAQRADSIVFNLGAILALIIGTLLLYAMGTAWLSVYLHTTFGRALAVGVYPYAALDSLKILASAVLLLPLRRRLAKQGLLGS